VNPPVPDTGVCPGESASLVRRRRTSEVDAEMERLSALRSGLERMLDGIPAPDGPDPIPAYLAAGRR